MNSNLEVNNTSNFISNNHYYFPAKYNNTPKSQKR